VQVLGMTAYTDGELTRFILNSQTASILERELAKRLDQAATALSSLQIEYSILSSVCREYEQTSVQVL
jgi:hypothetical protein